MKGKRNFSYEFNNNSKSQSRKKQNITFMLVDEGKVGIMISYNIFTNALRDLIKNKHNAGWNKDLKLWEIPLDNYKSCLTDLKQHYKGQNSNQQEPAINKIPQFVFNAQKQMGLDLQIKNNPYSVVKIMKYNQIQTAIEPRVLPFYYKLYDFQKESLDFGIKRHGRMLLADEMGVGKTIQSIALVTVYRHQWPFLVICPSSLRLNWQQEIINWLGDYLKKTEIQVYSKGGTAIRQSAKAVIISYDLAWKIRDTLESFQVVIADEAHYLKNTGNKRSDILMPFLSNRKRVILLSGTPALAKPRQIYNLISIIRPDIFTNFKEFGYRYCDPTVNPWSRALQFNGCQNSKELHYLISNRIMIRRLKKDVLTQLPDKQRQKIYVQTDKNIIKEIRQLLNLTGGGDQKNIETVVMEMLYKFDSNDSSETEDTRQAITMAYTLTGQAKLESVKQYILQILQNDIKILIFAHHRIMLDGLEAMIEEKKYKYIRIDGSISKEIRHQSVIKFQEDPTIKAAVLSITAAGVGLTLTAASTVIFAELHWTPGIMVQAEDRAHRIGQKSSVNCHYLIGQNSLDDILYRNLQKKVSNVSSFVQGKTQSLQIQKVSKGEKGKISGKLSDQNSSSNSRSHLLFKFQSIQPVLDKYVAPELSQDTDISALGTDPNFDSDIEQSETNHRPHKNKKQPLQIEQAEAIMEVQTFKKEQLRESEGKQIKDQTKSQEEMVTLSIKGSAQLGEFIKNNAQELLSFSQTSIDHSESTEPID